MLYNLACPPQPIGKFYNETWELPEYDIGRREISNHTAPKK